jgi:hypothetical protein
VGNLKEYFSAVDNSTTKPDWPPLPPTFRHDRHDLVDPTHSVGPAINQPLPPHLPLPLPLIRLDVCCPSRFPQLLGSLPNPELLQPRGLLDRPVDFYPRTGLKRGVGQSSEIDIRTQVDAAREHKRGDARVAVDAAKGVGRDGGCRAVVDDQGGTCRRRGGWARFAANHAREGAGNMLRIGRDLDGGAWAGFESGVA